MFCGMPAHVEAKIAQLRFHLGYNDVDWATKPSIPALILISVQSLYPCSMTTIRLLDNHNVYFYSNFAIFIKINILFGLANICIAFINLSDAFRSCFCANFKPLQDSSTV